MIRGVGSAMAALEVLHEVDQARAQHDSPGDPELYVPSRAEDRSFWWRMTYFAQKYLILWAPILWIVLSPNEPIALEVLDELGHRGG